MAFTLRSAAHRRSEATSFRWSNKALVVVQKMHLNEVNLFASIFRQTQKKNSIVVVAERRDIILRTSLPSAVVLKIKDKTVQLLPWL